MSVSFELKFIFDQFSSRSETAIVQQPYRAAVTQLCVASEKNKEFSEDCTVRYNKKQQVTSETFLQEKSTALSPDKNQQNCFFWKTLVHCYSKNCT